MIALAAGVSVPATSGVSFQAKSTSDASCADLPDRSRRRTPDFLEHVEQLLYRRAGDGLCHYWRIQSGYCPVLKRNSTSPQRLRICAWEARLTWTALPLGGMLTASWAQRDDRGLEHAGR